MKKKRILICILTMIMLTISMTNVFATMTATPASDINLDDPVDDNTSGDITELPANRGNANIDNGGIYKDGEVPANNNNKATNEMPNTGIEDLPIVAIGICIIAAGVGFAQIKKYGN